MNKTHGILALLLLVSASKPAQAQLFQNSNSSCEEKIVIGAFEPPPAGDFGNPFNSFSISCGKLNDDTAFGFDNFPDCITQRDPLPFNDVANLPATNPITNTLLVNTGAHGNNCFNLGGQAQIEDPRSLLNRSFAPDVDGIIRMGTIALGKLDADDLDDLAIVNYSRNTIYTPTDISNIQWTLNPNDINIFPSPDLILNEALFPNEHTAFPSTVYGGFTEPDLKRGSERSMVLENCNADPAEEALIVSHQSHNNEGVITESLTFLFSNNTGAGLENINNSIEIQELRFGSEVNSSLASADFNGDGLIDAAISINNDKSIAGNSPDQVILCLGTGNCGFDCLSESPYNLEASCDFPNCDPFPSSISSGDFNGDGLIDLAVGEVGFGRVRYLLNNGADFSTWSSQAVNFIPNGAEFPKPIVLQTGRFSTEAIQDNIDELAVTVARFQQDALGDYTVAQNQSTVEVIRSNLQGGFVNPLVLQFNPSLGTSISASGLDVRDFDHCGGDDILALSQTQEVADQVTQRASLFLNTNEAPTVTVEDTFEIDIDQQIQIPATCEDPTSDRRHFTWTIVQSPVGSSPTLTITEGDLIQPDQTDASTEFSADFPGVYTLEISCNDFCDATATAQTRVFVSTFPPPPPPPEVPATQGGCLASLHGNTRGNIQWSQLLFLAPVLVMAIRRRALQKMV